MPSDTPNMPLSDEDYSWLVSIVERGNEGDRPDMFLSDEANFAVYALAGETLESNPDEAFSVLAEHEGELRANIDNRTVNRVLRLALDAGYAAGHPGCTAFLGLMHKTGLGVLQDYGAAAAYFERASQLGSSQATVELGVLYATGRGRSKDFMRAYRLFSQAVALDENPEGLWRMGDMYRDGAFVARDLGVALRLYDNAMAATEESPALRAVPAHRMADMLLAGVEDVALPDPRAALLLYVQAELGYYLLIDSGETELQTALDQSIAGQAAARAAIAEERSHQSEEGVSDIVANRIAERLSQFMDEELSSPVATEPSAVRRGGRRRGPRHFSA